jgi:hypothetical protein
MKKILLLAGMVSLFSSGAFAEIYKCVENGKLTISDTPCPPDAVSTVVTPEPERNAPAFSSAEELERIKQKLEMMQHERQEREAADEQVAQQAEREKAAQEAAARKAEEEKLSAWQKSAQRKAVLKKKREKERCLSSGQQGCY